MPNPDGSIVYIHIISPVVKDADYSVMNNIYSAVKDPAEQKTVFDMYRGAMKQAALRHPGPDGRRPVEVDPPRQQADATEADPRSKSHGRVTPFVALCISRPYRGVRSLRH